MLAGWPAHVVAHEYGQPPPLHRTHAPFPGPRHYIYLDELPATPANAQKYVTLAHRAMATCGNVPAATAEYRGALAALHAKQYRNAMATSRNIVDDCATR